MLLIRPRGVGKSCCNLITNFMRAKRALRRYMRQRLVRRANMDMGGVQCFNDRP